MDFQSAMETFAEAWVAANTQTPLTEAAEAQNLMLGQSSMGGNMPVGTPCLHDLTAERREKQETCESVRSGLRSPNPGHTAYPLDFRSSLKTSSSASSTSPTGKSLPVHCIVEQVSNVQGGSQSGEATQTSVEMDSFAIVPVGALFNDLVRTALIKLGYSATEAVGAKGAIQIKNWKPLMFDQITEAAEATVGDILGDLVTVATLRIRLYSRPKMNVANDMKEKLLQVLLAQSQSMLLNSGCPIDQVTPWVESLLTALTKGRTDCDIPDDTRKKFDQWYLQQVFQHCRQVALLQHHVPHQHHQPQPQQQQQPPPPPPTQPETQQRVSSPPPHPLAQELTTRTLSSQGRTRIRTSFDPELELPKLHRWFAENQHPSRLQIQQYVKELNSLESRRGRKPLDVNNVVYWFKNARAAHKRAEQKCCTDSNGLQSPCSEPLTESQLIFGRNTAGDQGFIGDGLNSCRVENMDCRGPGEMEGGRFSMGDSLSESQINSSDESDNAHTLDLSVRRERCHNGSLKPETECSDMRVKEEPRDSCSDHSLDSSDSGDEEVDVMDDATMVSEEQEARQDSLVDSIAHQNGSINESDFSVPQSQGDVDHHQMSPYSSTSISHLEERRKRNRTFIDPVTEVPRLEQWFSVNTHPAHSQIVRYTQELNSMPYRQKFPKLEPKNIQFWFKNRRAKCKRLNLASLQSSVSCGEKLVMSST